MNDIFIKHTDGNATLEVAEALKQIKMTETNVIHFEKGRYTFFRAGTFEGRFYPSNNTSGLKSVVFPILNVKDLIIDGWDSEFVFCDRIFPFIIQNSENITLKNFNVDFSSPRHYEATVVRADEEGIELKIDRSLYKFDADGGSFNFYDGSYIDTTSNRKFFLNDLCKEARVAYLVAGETTDSLDNLPASVLRTDAYETENGIFLKYRKGSPVFRCDPNDTVFIGNEKGRENGIFFAEFSKNISLKNIKVFRGAGMGVIAQICTNISIDGLEIAPKKGRDKRLSITADGLHFVNCDGKITVKNSLIEKTIDDALNLHGVYSLVDEVLSSNSVRLRFGHFEQNGLIPFQAGDIAVVNDMKKGLEIGEARVAAVDFNEDRTNIVLTFENDISELIVPGNALENPGRMAELEFVNNRIYDTPHMRISTCKDAIVSDNQIYNTTIVVNDLYDYWYESGTVENLKIVNNEFKTGGNKLAIAVKSCRRGEGAKRHKNITIVHNSFDERIENIVTIDAVENLTMKDNVVVLKKN